MRASKVSSQNSAHSGEISSNKDQNVSLANNQGYLEMDENENQGSSEVLLEKGGIKEGISRVSGKLRYHSSFIPEEHRISDFHDMEYGEPMRIQNVEIDFRPVKGLDDTEYLTNKCCDFWRTLEMHPEIQHLKEFPMKEDFAETSRPSSSTTTTRELKMPSTEALDWLDHEKILTCSLATKLIDPYCDEKKGDYSIGSPTKTHSEHSATYIRKSDICPENTCIFEGRKPEIKIKRRTSLNKYYRKAEVINLCQEMEEWEMNHPKSMDPPGHPPLLSHAVMQKNC